MKTNKKLEQIELITEELSEHLRVVRDLLTDIVNVLDEKEEPTKAVKIEVKVTNPYDNAEVSTEELEQIKKDLEEMINDFTRK